MRQPRQVYLYLLSFVLNFLSNTNAYPDKMKCDNYPNMGLNSNLNKMGAIASAYSSSQILINGKTLSANTGTYTPGSTLTVSLSPYSGQIVFQANGGAIFQGSVGKSGQGKASDNVNGIISDSACNVLHLSRYQMYTDAFAVLTMPTSGIVTIECNYALSQGTVYVTPSVTLTLAAESTSGPPTFKPTIMNPIASAPPTLNPTTLKPTTLSPTTLKPTTFSLRTSSPTTLMPTLSPTDIVINVKFIIVTVVQDIANVDIVSLKTSTGQNIFTQTVVNSLTTIGVTSDDIKITDISSKSNRKYFHSQELESATVTYTISVEESLAPSIELLLKTSISNGSFEKYFKDQAVTSDIDGLTNTVINTAPIVNFGTSTDVPNDNPKDSSLAGGVAVGTSTLILLFEWIAGIFGALFICFCLLMLVYNKQGNSDDDSDNVDNSSETCLDRLFAWMENECKLLFTKVSESSIFTDVRMDKVYPAFNFTNSFRTSPYEAEDAIKESKRLSSQTVRGSETILRRDSGKPLLSDDRNLQSSVRSVSILFTSPSQRKTPRQMSLDSNE